MPKTKQTKENLRETFLTDLVGIFKIAGYRKSFFASWTTIAPIFLSLLSCILSLYLGISTLKFLVELKSLMLNFLPGILGFTIAGYSLMVGFIQAGVLDKITEPAKDSKFSLYQIMSSAFAMNIIFQAIALIIAYFVHFIVFIDENKKRGVCLPDSYVFIVNLLGLLILSYWFFISLLMVIQIVINIFSFSQLHHYFVNKAKLDENDLH